MNTRLEEVMSRIGSRPALIRMSSVADFFGEDAPYRIEDGVAMINISGPLSNAKWSWGGTTYGEIQDQAKIAAADPNVKAILLNVNSPGGETDNAFETAAILKQAAQQKPMYSCAATMAYSAAYLLAAQAEKIYCTPTSGGVGSVGVYCAHLDYSEMLKQAGIKVTLISAGEGKTDGSPYAPLSASAEDSMQEEIDRLYGEFVASVASGRGMDSASVVKLGARCYEGSAKAIGSNLADAPGDLSTAWVDLCALTQQSGWSPLMRKDSAATAAMEKKRMTEQEAADKAKAMADANTAAIEKARQEGHAEAGMIVDLCMLAGRPELTAGFLGEKKSANQVRKELMAAKAKSQDGQELNTGIMPGADTGAKPGSNSQGKAKPWGEVLSALGFKKRGN